MTMDEEITQSQYLLPFGDDLRAFLTQDKVTPSMLRKVLRSRGVFISSIEKKDMLEHLLLSFLAPSEFVHLLDEVREKEDSPKLRSRSYTISSEAPPLAEMLPIDFEFNKIAQDEYGNVKIIGEPSFARDKIEGKDSYLLSYRLEKQSIGADWTRCRRIYEASIRYTLNPVENRLEVATTHSSPETEKANRQVVGHVNSELRAKHYIETSGESKVLFGSFTNEQRIFFLMKFPGINSQGGLSFVKLADLALALDSNTPTPDEERLNWMKDSVNKLTLSGDALQNVFFVNDPTCWKHLLVWRTEARFKFETVDFSGSIEVIFEFADCANGANPDAEFQIAIPRISLEGRAQGSPDSIRLKRQFTMYLDAAKTVFVQEALNYSGLVHAGIGTPVSS
ncbi:GapS4b family protein [Verrucomicrobium spinosum]|nr:hypothetical protein [Verrucomicrobium spinosum]